MKKRRRKKKKKKKKILKKKTKDEEKEDESFFDNIYLQYNIVMSNIFQDLTFGLIGKLSKTHSKIIKLIIQHGGNATSTITQNITHIITTQTVVDEGTSKKFMMIEDRKNIVSENFIHDSIAQGKLEKVENYSLKDSNAEQNRKEKDLVEDNEEKSRKSKFSKQPAVQRETKRIKSLKEEMKKEEESDKESEDEQQENSVIEQDKESEKEMEDHWDAGKKQYQKLVKNEEWLKKYKGKFIAIDKNGKVVISEDDQRARNTKVLQLGFQPYVVVAGIGPIHINTYTVNCTLGVPPPPVNALHKFVTVNVGNTAATATHPVNLQMDEGADITWLPNNMITVNGNHKAAKSDIMVSHFADGSTTTKQSYTQYVVLDGLTTQISALRGTALLGEDVMQRYRRVLDRSQANPATITKLAAENNHP